MVARIFIVILLFIAILFLPFWLSFIIAAGAMFFFSFFAEAVLLFLLSDLLFGIPEERYAGIVFLSFILSLILLIVIESAKRKMRIYRKETK